MAKFIGANRLQCNFRGTYIVLNIKIFGIILVVLLLRPIKCAKQIDTVSPCGSLSGTIDIIYAAEL